MFTAASKAKHLFSASELAELDVYGLWAVLRQQVSTAISCALCECTVSRGNVDRHPVRQTCCQVLGPPALCL